MSVNNGAIKAYCIVLDCLWQRVNINGKKRVRGTAQRAGR